MVADVQAYAEFLPGCEAVEVLETRILPEGISEVVAKVTAASRGLRQEFITTNRCQPSQRIQMSLQEARSSALKDVGPFRPLGMRVVGLH